MSASSNFGNIFSVLGASAWLPFLPMAPIQLLTNNLLYDFSQTALPTDNVDDDSLRKPHRWEVGKMGEYILCMGPVSSVFDYLTFATLFRLLGANTPAQAALFQTGWFIESLFSQTLIVHIIRTRRLPFVESRPSPGLLATTIGLCLVGAWLPYSPLAESLGMQPLPAAYWPLLAAILVGYAGAALAARRLLAR
jgi:Mg2+-importing ATPase